MPETEQIFDWNEIRNETKPEINNLKQKSWILKNLLCEKHSIRSY